MIGHMALIRKNSEACNITRTIGESERNATSGSPGRILEENIKLYLNETGHEVIA
jgi:hypothetical protein